MAIANRELDISQRKVSLRLASNSTDIGVNVTLYVGTVPFPAQIKKVQVAGRGLSGTPSYGLQVHRWTSAGLTVFDPLGTAATLAGAFGLSGGSVAMSVTSSPIALAADDMLVIKSAGANTAVQGLTVDIVIAATQDIVSMYGSAT